jgi:hypothetical protein
MKGAEKQSGGGIGVLNVEDWKLRAKRIRVIAATMLDAASRQALLQVAEDWERMVQLVTENIAPDAGMTLVPEVSSEDDADANPNA